MVVYVEFVGGDDKSPEGLEARGSTLYFGLCRKPVMVTVEI